MPSSLWLFAFTLIVYLLQQVPGTDGALMILAASMWPIITVNLGLPASPPRR